MHAHYSVPDHKCEFRPAAVMMTMEPDGGHMFNITAQGERCDTCGEEYIPAQEAHRVEAWYHVERDSHG